MATAARLLVGCATFAAASSSSTCAATAEISRANAATSGDQVMLQVGARGGVSLLEPACANLPDVERTCSADGCTVLADRMRGRSCADYCGASGLQCVGAWEEVNDDCAVKHSLLCDDASVPTSDLLCQCAPEGSSVEPTAPASVGSGSGGNGEKRHLRTFFWNVHWECSVAARGASHSCKSRIGRRFAELAKQSSAEIVASVELSDGMSDPASLEQFGLSGWTQVNGPCKNGHGGDSAALAFAPGWAVQATGGGCLRHDHDTRAFAVARVAPPSPVEGCPSLCVVAIHAPHSHITKGKDVVERVCGDAVERCAVAMGDWNVPGHGVAGLWANLIGGSHPHKVFPDERTCCWPEHSHYGIFDHLATNIPGAAQGESTVHPYQLLEETPVKQHRAVSASILLPGHAALVSRGAEARAIKA